MSMRSLIVRCQEVFAEVMGVVAKNRVDMVRTVLGVVVLDHKPIVADVVVVALESF